MKPMRAGRLRHLVALQQPVAGAADATGHATESWATYATVHAEITPQTARQISSANAEDGRITHVLTIRARGDVTSEHQVVWGGRTMRIVRPPIDIDERGRLLQLLCDEVA